MPPPVRVPSLARSANARLQSGFDVFLSHDWGMDSLDRQNHSRVSRVNDVLRQAGFRTWFDGDRMRGDINAAMSAGIDKSGAVIVFVTANYIAKIAGEGPRGANDNWCARCRHVLPTRICAAHACTGPRHAVSSSSTTR